MSVIMTDTVVNKNSRVLEGIVVSDKMDKSIVVRVLRTFKHAHVSKVVRSAKKYKAHDEENRARIGDWVEIIETRPLSKTKHMMLNRIVKKAE